MDNRQEAPLKAPRAISPIAPTVQEDSELVDLLVAIADKGKEKGFSSSGLDSLAQKHFKKNIDECNKQELNAIYNGLCK